MAIADDIRAREAALYRAMIAKDFAALEEILAPELTYVHSTAVSEDKRAYLAGVARGLYEYETIASRDVRLDLHGTIALQSGILDMSVSETGKPKEMTHLLFVLAWVDHGDAWRLLYRQATRIFRPSPSGSRPLT